MATATYPQQVKPRRKRRIFLWVFLAIQVIFLVLVIVQLSGNTSPAHSQVAAGCLHGNWQGLFSSQADCLKHYRVGLADAGNLGKGIGAGLIIGLWVAVDVILGVSYLIYRLAHRPRVVVSPDCTVLTGPAPATASPAMFTCPNCGKPRSPGFACARCGTA